MIDFRFDEADSRIIDAGASTTRTGDDTCGYNTFDTDGHAIRHRRSHTEVATTS
jgi:hypothetical protein